VTRTCDAAVSGRYLATSFDYGSGRALARMGATKTIPKSEAIARADGRPTEPITGAVSP